MKALLRNSNAERRELEAANADKLSVNNVLRKRIGYENVIVSSSLWQLQRGAGEGEAHPIALNA